MALETWLRPSAAARRYGVSLKTLARWAKDRKIGRSKVGSIVHYWSGDISELLARHTTVRTTEPKVPALLGDVADWQSDPLWSTRTTV